MCIYLIRNIKNSIYLVVYIAERRSLPQSRMRLIVIIFLVLVFASCVCSCVAFRWWSKVCKFS